VTKKEELLALMLIPGGDRTRIEKLVDDLEAGKISLPPCFNIKRSGPMRSFAR
jgi:hypothetical protein